MLEDEDKHHIVVTVIELSKRLVNSTTLDTSTVDTIVERLLQTIIVYNESYHYHLLILLRSPKITRIQLGIHLNTCKSTIKNVNLIKWNADQFRKKTTL